MPSLSPRLQRASLLLGQSRYDLAEQELRMALAEDPDSAIGHSLLARCLAERKDYQGATEEARLAIHLAPDAPFTHYYLSLVLGERNHLPEAIAAIQEAIRLDPYDADFFARLAALQFESRGWAATLATAEQGLACDPEHADCTNVKAMALVKLGHRKLAESAIEGALARDPENAYSHANQGWTLLESGEHAQALTHFREALRLEPGLEWARQGMVEALQARYFVYRIMLGYFLWMMKLSGRAQWGVLMGLFVVNLLLNSLAKANPVLAPWVTPIIVLYVAFAMMTWISRPLFNLVLRVSRFGRFALSREEVITSNMVGGLLLLAVVFLIGYFVTWRDLWYLAALTQWLVIIPVSAIYRCQPGWPRKTLARISLGLFALGNLSLLALIGVNLTTGILGWVLLIFGAVGGGIFVIVAFSSQFIANALVLVQVRK